MHPIRNLQHIKDLRNKVIHHLKYNIYCRLKASPVHEVGLFAIKNIPQGVCPLIPWKYKTTNQMFDKQELLLKGVHHSVIKIFTDAHFHAEGKVSVLLFEGFEFHTNLLMYMNHSDTPNVQWINYDFPPSYGLYKNNFYTIREIKAGEELFEDYGMLQSFGHSNSNPF